MNNQITILGAGVIGLSQALFLLKKGFNLTLIDPFVQPLLKPLLKPNHAVYSRVLALSPQTKDFLETLGAFEERATPYYHMRVWDGKGSGHIAFDATELGVPALGYIIEQAFILEALCHQLKPYLEKGKLIWLEKKPIALQRDSAERIGVKLEDNCLIYSELLIGADGANSWLRTAAGLAFTEQSYSQTAIVATIRAEKKHDNTAYQRFSESGPLALLPLSDPNHLSIVWTQATEISQALFNLSEADFNQALSQFSEKILGELCLVGKRSSMALRSLQAQPYGADRVVLIGDSAHVIHPLAGLGANLGFQDVMTLGGLLVKQGDAQRDLGSQGVIQRYYRQRIAHNEAVKHSMTALNRLFRSQNPLVKVIRNQGLDKINAFLGLKKWFAKQAIG